MNDEKREVFLRTYAHATALKEKGAVAEAKDLLSELVNDPNDIECGADYELFGSAYFHLGEIAYSVRDLCAAETYLETCLNLYPEHAKAQEEIRVIKRKAGKEIDVEALVSPDERAWQKKLKQMYVEKYARWWEWQEHYYGDRVRGQCQFEERTALFEYIYNDFCKAEPMAYLEFGVHTGNSLKWWLARDTDSDSRFYGFDSFRGLPEFWIRYPKGRFDTGGAFPGIDDSRCTFIAGFFQDTLDDFLTTFDTPFKKIIHFDADLYSSTFYVLSRLASLLNPDDILMFDEFRGAVDEFKAFLDFQAVFNVPLQLVAGTKDRLRAVFKVQA